MNEQIWVVPTVSDVRRILVEKEPSMYVIVVTVYTGSFEVESQRVWKGQIFHSKGHAEQVKDTILHKGDITLVVKALR